MSGIWFGFEIAVGLVIGVVVTIRVLMFLRLVKYRRGNVQDAPEDLRPRLMRENLEVIRRKADSLTKEQRTEAFTMLMSNLIEPWDKETYAEITRTLAHVASLDKENEAQLNAGKQRQHVPPMEFIRDQATGKADTSGREQLYRNRFYKSRQWLCVLHRRCGGQKYQRSTNG